MVTLSVVLLTAWSHAQTKTVFVTSETTDGSIAEAALTGRAAADAICNRLATAANLDMTNGPYRAWLGDSSTSPATDTTFTKATIPYELPDGTQVAPNFNGLIGGSLTSALNKDENNATPPSTVVWTGTNNIGGTSISTSNCVDWGSNAANDTGTIGANGLTSGQWIFFNFSTCDLIRPLYCIQQGPPGPPPTPTATATLGPTPTVTPTGMPAAAPADTIPTLDWRGFALLIGLLLLFGVVALRRLNA